MFEADISPRPMMSVDIFTTEITEQVGAAAFRAASTAQARTPTVTGFRHGLVQAVRATSAGTATIPIVGAAGSGSGIVLAPTAIMSGAAPVPVVAADTVVNAVTVTSIGVAKPVTVTVETGDASATAPISGGTLSTPVPVVISEAVLTSVPTYDQFNSGVAARNGTAIHTIGHSTAATAPSSGCELSFVPATGSLLAAIMISEATHTSTGTGPGSGWVKQEGPATSAEMALFTKVAVGNDFLTITQNGSNYGPAWVVYAFPPGSSYVDSVSESVNSNAFPNFPSLPGTGQFIVSAFGFGIYGGAVPTGGSTVSDPWVEASDSITGFSTTSGQYLYIFHQPQFNGTSITPTFTYGVTGGTQRPERQKIIAAFDVSGAIRSNMIAIPPVVTGA